MFEQSPISGTEEAQSVKVALLPCPHCGGAALLQEHEAHEHSEWLVKATGLPKDIPASWTVECPSCSNGMIHDSKDEVVAAWNRRAAPALPQDIAALVERFATQIEAAQKWAEAEKPSDAKGMPSAFELEVGHLRILGGKLILALRSQSAALASAREVIGDIEDYIANAQSHYATLFDRGQGIHGQPGYVVDAVWNAWTGKRLLADELSRAISDIRAAREWKGR